MKLSDLSHAYSSAPGVLVRGANTLTSRSLRTLATAHHADTKGGGALQ